MADARGRQSRAHGGQCRFQLGRLLRRDHLGLRRLRRRLVMRLHGRQERGFVGHETGGLHPYAIQRLMRISAQRGGL